MKYLLILLMTFAFLTGCSKEKISASDSAKADYEYAQQAIDSGDFRKASLFLEKFSSKHPYSQHLAGAELLRIYAVFKNSEYVLSETLSTRFITSHPRHPDMAYAQYMLAMSHFKQTVDAQRDPAPTQHSIEAFTKLIKEFPESIYISEAQIHLQNLRNQLAEHELYVGKFYFQRHKFVAASNRFQMVLKEYQTSPAIEESLYYLSASFASLKLADNARDTAILLRHNYPKSDWSEKAAKFL